MKTIKNAIWGLLVFAALTLTGCPELGLGMLNFTALDAAIVDANTAKADVETSVDGSNISPTKEWVTQEVMDALELVITAAATVKSQATTQEQVDNAVTALNTAITVFNEARKSGTKAADEDDLDELIVIAEALMEGVQISDDGSDISPSVDWVTQSVWDALESAIENAETVAGENTAEAFEALLTAKNTFENAMKKGTQGIVPTEFSVNNSAQWNTAITSIKNDNNTHYVIDITGSFGVNGSYDFTFGDRSGITVTINGNHTISLNENSTGNLLRINNNQTVIMNDLILKGHQTNNVPLVLLNGNLTMRGDSEIWNNKGDWGGGVRVDGPGIFTLESGKIYQNIAQWNGGGVNLNPGAEFIMKGGEIHENQAGCGGGVFLWIYSQFTMEGGEIYENEAIEVGGGVNMNSSIFTMKNSARIHSNKSAGDGGGVFIDYKEEADDPGVFIMEGGEIFNNESSSEGGGVYILKSSFTMEDGEIYDNTAKGGTGVSIREEAEFIMRGNAKIHSNTATEWDGGGVSIRSSNFIMEGGEISNNTARYGAGVSIREGSEFIMTGNAIISYNTAESNAGGVHVYQGKFTMTGGAVSYNEAEWGAGVSIREEGEFIMSGNAKINYNTATEGDGGGVHVYQGNFTMEDGEISYNTASWGGGVYIEGSNFTMEGGEISYNTANWVGGGVSIKDGSVFTMRNNAKVHHNTNNMEDGADGGGVHIDFGGNSFFMEGGVISSNTAARGAGVSIREEGEFIMSGSAKIHDNKAEWEGGGVLVYHGNFTMEGGEIYENEAKGGAGVNIQGESEFTMSGNAKIHNNTATEWDGGGVFIGGDSNFTMSGGEISYNTTAIWWGAGVYVGEGGEFTMKDDAVICYNTSIENGGGGVDIYLGKFTMEGGEISYNTANVGAGVSIREEGEFIMSGNSIISNNIATWGGGGVYISSGSIIMDGGEIYGNTADAGGGVYVNSSYIENDDGDWFISNGEFIMKGGIVYGNNASEDHQNIAESEYGAALYVGYENSYARYRNNLNELVDIPLAGDEYNKFRDLTIRVTNGELTDN